MLRILFLSLLLIQSSYAEDTTGFNNPYINTNINNIVPSTKILFYNKNNELVGTIEWESDEVKFTGNIDESAKTFFEYFTKYYLKSKECQQ